jgi:hypothetical protein
MSSNIIHMLSQNPTSRIEDEVCVLCDVLGPRWTIIAVQVEQPAPHLLAFRSAWNPLKRCSGRESNSPSRPYDRWQAGSESRSARKVLISERATRSCRKSRFARTTPFSRDRCFGGNDWIVNKPTEIIGWRMFKGAREPLWHPAEDDPLLRDSACHSVFVRPVLAIADCGDCLRA